MRAHDSELKQISANGSVCPKLRSIPRPVRIQPILGQHNSGSLLRCVFFFLSFLLTTETSWSQSRSLLSARQQSFNLPQGVALKRWRWWRESRRGKGRGRTMREVFFTSGAVKCGVHSALTYSLIGHSLLLKKGHRPPVIHLVASRGRICFFWHATNRNYLFTVPALRLLLLLGLPLALCSRIQIQILCLHRGTAILFKTWIAG